VTRTAPPARRRQGRASLQVTAPAKGQIELSDGLRVETLAVATENASKPHNGISQHYSLVNMLCKYPIVYDDTVN